MSARRVERPQPPDLQPPDAGWRHARVAPSLAEVYRSVPVGSRSVWRKLLAFAGPGYLVAVGYMDPGNWATDLAGGSKFGYTLLSVILASNLMAGLLPGIRSQPRRVPPPAPPSVVCRPFPPPRVRGVWGVCYIASCALPVAR